MHRPLAIGLLTLLSFPTGLAHANGGGDEELIASFTPTYSHSDTTETEDASASLNGSASASAEVSMYGSINLAASVGGTLLPKSLPLAGGSPSATATGEVGGDWIPWNGEGLRIESTFSYRLRVMEQENLQVDPLVEAQDGITALVHTFFRGDALNPIADRLWSSTSTKASRLESNRVDQAQSNGMGTAISYARADCGGSVIRPVVSASLSADLPQGNLRLQQTQRQATLEVYVSSIKVFRQIGTPCIPVQRISVTDNAFSPVEVSVSRYDYVRFDFSQASATHDIVIGLWGSSDAENTITISDSSPERMFSSGTHTYYCRLHGTVTGEGMAGTLNVD